MLVWGHRLIFKNGALSQKRLGAYRLIVTNNSVFLLILTILILYFYEFSQ